MADFNLYDYSKENKNTKLKVFIEYLFEKCGNDNNEFDNNYFTILTVDDLIESLSYYIINSSITAQNTANTYIAKLIDFFKFLSDNYGIRNDIFTNYELYNQFIFRYKEIIAGLRKTESKDIATDEQYELLTNGLNEYLNTYDITEIYDEVNEYYEGEQTGIKKYIQKYHRFVSVLPVMLILKFALKDLTVVLLELNDLDLENELIMVNGFELPLDYELIKHFKSYLKVRDHILELYSKQENKLFIKHNGVPYIKSEKERSNSPDYGNFLKIMKDFIGSQSGEIFAVRRIVEMLDKGMDIFTVLKLTEKSTQKFYNLMDDVYSKENINKKIHQFFYGDTKIDRKYIVKKGGTPEVKCPFCGSLVEAVSEEWVLVQLKEDGKKYLACRKCKGENGNHII
ncbi:hypothetical protein acsn021_32710 [Anaerocolumna cellulosilytica]|uniref:Uncharacterized protein n=1 Tax=Anaerocolumna cellulosilytica TaxID=433286 RepID=A0A6S6R8S5_9FIRM|nr:hypothetical protein [Anaerocolumna cellulosilytica]MBB5196602.1 hypothetical protein [Anaerocolumna cellulosilytica]BCJ95702.1 hypothetical protein acsn021_32710 [Anaerocolumna cellulosilytica]